MNMLDVLRKDSFFFMRDEPVDVKRYLPQWLNKSPLFSSIQDALNIEHEKYRLKLVDVAKQFFVETATWGLDEWERFLKITPSAGASEDLRRAVIRVKRRGDTVMTVENTKALLRDFAPRGEVDIRELGGNKLELLIHNGTFWWDELMQALWEQLPAHLAFDFELSRTIDFPHYVALIDLLQGWIHYDQRYRESVPQSMRVAQGLVTAGNVQFDVSAKHVVNRASQTIRAGFTEIVHGKIRFDCVNELPDEETIEDFERYLLRRWREFKQNPIIEHYRHHRRGAEDEPVTAGDISHRFYHRKRHGFIELINGRIRFGLDVPPAPVPPDPPPVEDIKLRFAQKYYTGSAEMAKGYIRFGVEMSPDEPATDFERNFANKYYSRISEVTEGYIRFGADRYDFDDDEEEIILDRDFLRLWWAFPYETKKGEQRIHVRSTTILDPRQDVTAGEIKALGNIGAAGEIFTWRKDRILTTGIIKAMYVRKQQLQII